MWAPRRWVQLAVSNLSLLMNNHSILRVYGFCQISRFRGIRDLVVIRIRYRSHALPRHRHADKEAWRESRARGRVFRTRFHMSNHARVAPRPLRSKFGEIENFRFRNFVVRFGPYLPALSCVRSLHIGGNVRFSQNLPENIDS